MNELIISNTKHLMDDLVIGHFIDRQILQIRDLADYYPDIDLSDMLSEIDNVVVSDTDLTFLPVSSSNRAFFDLNTCDRDGNFMPANIDTLHKVEKIYNKCLDKFPQITYRVPNITREKK